MMYAASSSSSSSTSSTLRASGDQTRRHKSTSGKRHQTTLNAQHSATTSPSTLQSLVRTKCWSIAPLWKFVTYELEHNANPQRPTAFNRSSSVRKPSKKEKNVISYENDFMYNMASVNGGQRRNIWSKPHPQQSLNNVQRQPLQPSNHRNVAIVYEQQPCKVHHPVLTTSTASSTASSSNDETTNGVVETEWKPCGVLKKPGSYRSHAGLKKVAFLENTELNRSTL